MWSVAVVVLDVLVDHGSEMATTEDEHPVQTFTPDSADEALSEGVRPGRPDRSPDDPDALGAEDLVESGCELGVAIADQERDRSGSLGELMGQIPGLLDDPCSRWVSSDPGYVHLSGVEFDEELDVEPPQEHGIHREEVAGSIVVAWAFRN